MVEDDELIQTWIVHHLQVIGEAAKKISPETRELEPGIPWGQIAGMRNILVHEYFSIDTELVWTTVEKDLPQLKEAIDHLLTV